MPLSETTSMPLSCAEPGEEAVQIPHPIAPHSKPPSDAAQTIVSSTPLLQGEVNGGYKPAATTTPRSVVMPSKPATTPRFRLELPQFSTFSRKDRNSMVTPGTGIIYLRDLPIVPYREVVLSVPLCCKSFIGGAAV